MPGYAPFYKAPTSRQPFLAREQKRERKRKREAGGDDDEQQDFDEQSPEPQDDTPRVPHPVNRTDPYYVAGHPREKPLPGGNFPHAAIKEYRPSDISVEEQLSQLNPPVFVPKVGPQEQNASLKRRHMDNLTAILHQCMLNQDWDRASRVWGLILRTEIQGYGPDIRRNGHWTIGAEILMRRGQTFQRVPTSAHATHDAQDDFVQPEDNSSKVVPVPPAEGFELARKYYERLILQYPDRPRAPHTTVNALAFYPALFSVWIYDVQEQANRARLTLSSSDNTSATVDHESNNGNIGNEIHHAHNEILTRELEGANAIAHRMDEILLSPPYDISSELLYTRGMVGLWLSNLNKDISDVLRKMSVSTSDDDYGEQPFSIHNTSTIKARYHRQSGIEKQKARVVFEKMATAKLSIPDTIQNFWSTDDESGMVDKDDSG